MSVRRSEASRARSQIFHALAEALAEPGPDVQELLLGATTAGAQVAGSVACQEAALRLAELPAIRIEALRESYRQIVFGRGGRPLALHESLHRQSCLVGEATTALAHRYQSLGVIPAEGELPDHASVELAFLGHLAAAEAEARAAGDGRLVARLQAEQRDFLRTHAGAWLPAVGDTLAASGRRFYAAVGNLLRDYLREEADGRTRTSRPTTRLPVLVDPDACTLCGLCTGSCPPGALRVMESHGETMLTLEPSRCVACRRCERTCPEQVLILSEEAWASNRPDPLGGATATRSGGCSHLDAGSGRRVIRVSPRALCPSCGRPTVSLAELDTVFARLDAGPALQQRLSLCVACKSM